MKCKNSVLFGVKNGERTFHHNVDNLAKKNSLLEKALLKNYNKPIFLSKDDAI